MIKLPLRIIAKRSCRPLTAMALLKGFLFVGLSSVTVAVPAADPASPVTLEGTVLILIEDDFEHGRSRTSYFLRERRSNERLELQLSPQQAKQIRPGQELRVRGGRSGKVLAADPGADAVTVLTELATLVPAKTTRRVINLIVDITDGGGITHTVHGACDDGWEQILVDDMFGSRGSRNIDGCFRESSNDLLGFGGASYPGTAMDVVRVAITEPSPSLGSVCNPDAWAVRADAAAVAQGVDLSAYQHRMYVLPVTTTGCWWGGWAYIGCGESCQAWVRASTNLPHSDGPCGARDLLAHELGHNLGMRHASTDSNNDGISDCEYCDTTDIMGYSLFTWRGFNAPRRAHMGWLGADQIVDGASGGVFTISALGMRNSPYPQVVKIVPPSGWPYWLSYRAPIGYDAAIFQTFHFNKLHVHRADESGYSYLITELADGATHVDVNVNLTVRQLSHTFDSATLEVRFEAAYSLSTSSLAFGYQLLNSASSAPTILLRNGGMTLPITSIAIGGTNPLQFAQTNNCGASLAPGAGCTIEVTFKPTTAGVKTAALSVTAGGGAGTKTVALSGTGTGSAYTLSTSSLAFGNQAVHFASSAKTLTLRSTGVSALPITSIAIGGSNPGQFAQTNNCGTSVAAGASCAIKVTFKPTVTGSKVAILSVTAGNGAGTKTASLSGTGVVAAYSLSISSLAFANQALNLASSAKTITLRNTGVAALPITSIVLGGTNPLQFAQTNSCGASVAAGASCAINMTFKPTRTGSMLATLSVTAGGGAGTKSATLSGTGMRSTFSVFPTALSFGNVARNATSTAKTVRITNTGGVLLPITSINLAGTNPGQFTRTNNCPARVAIGGSCTVSVVFKPTSTGAKSAILQVTPGGGAVPKSATLSGRGI